MLVIIMKISGEIVEFHMRSGLWNSYAMFITLIIFCCLCYVLFQVSDFGLSIMKGGVGTEGMMQNMCGTPMYMGKLPCGQCGNRRK